MIITNTLYNTNPTVLHCPCSTTPTRRLITDLFPYVPRCKFQISEELTIFTSSNREGKTIFEEQFDIFGIPYKVLGKRYKNQKWSNRYKLILALEYLPRVKTKYVMAVDGLDVLFFDNPQKALDSFVQCGSKLLFNSTTGNWPKIKRLELPVVDGHMFRYLNAGLWIGETEFTRTVFEDWKSVMPLVEEDIDQYKDLRRDIIRDDQIIMRYLQRKHESAGAAIDSRCEVFQSVLPSSREYVQFSGFPRLPKRWKNRRKWF